MPSVLCPALYGRMRELFGRVDIANQGEETVVRRQADDFSGQAGKIEVVLSGEYYRASCPECNDTRRRMWIGYRFGEFPWLVHCFNSHCFSGANGRRRRRVLHELLTGSARPVALPYAPGQVDEYALASSTGPLPAVAAPGRVVPLSDLHRDHHAIRYLIGRRLDPAELSDRYSVGYCQQSDNRFVEGRIIIPVIMNGVMVGWQGRWPDDLDWKKVSIPKSYNNPHMPRRRMFYGYDSALHYRTIVIVEGPIDAWSVGGNALAVLGSTLAGPQREMLAKHWGQGAVVVMLDGEAVSEREQMVEELEPIFPGRVLPIALPHGVDPGGMDRDPVWGLIRDTAASRGMSLDLNYYPGGS